MQLASPGAGPSWPAPCSWEVPLGAWRWAAVATAPRPQPAQRQPAPAQGQSACSGHDLPPVGQVAAQGRQGGGTSRARWLREPWGPAFGQVPDSPCTIHCPPLPAHLHPWGGQEVMPVKGECPGLEGSPKLASSRPGGQPLPAHVLIWPCLQAAGRTVFGPPPKPSRVSHVLSLLSHRKRKVLSWVMPGLDRRGGAEAWAVTVLGSRAADARDAPARAVGRLCPVCFLHGDRKEHVQTVATHTPRARRPPRLQPHAQRFCSGHQPSPCHPVAAGSPGAAGAAGPARRLTGTPQG